MVHLPSEGNLFTAKPEPLADLLGGIHQHKIALPDFQRPWVWEPEMVRDLLMSVAYRYPAGSLLTMPVSTASFALRPFQGSGDTLKATPNLMILDGQQRLTSLYQSLYRRDGVTFRGRTYHFYLDIPVLMADPDGIEVGDPYFDAALFYVLQDKWGKRVRYDGLKPRYEISTREQELEAGVLPLGCIFDANGYLAQWKTDYLVRQSAKDMDRFLVLNTQWDQLVQPWLDRIRSYPFPVVELRADMPLGAICHIFEKVNSTGVPLDVFDLCTAILWSQGFRLNIEWDATKAKLKTILPMQPLSGTYFLQGLALLDSLDRKRAAPTAGVAVSCRKQELMSMKRETVERWWPILVDGYGEAASFMTDQGILSDRILPYSTMIVPLAAIFADVKRRKGNVWLGAAWAKIEQWYWCSVFSQRYSSQIEYSAAQDVEQVSNWIDGGEAPDVVRRFVFRADALQEITSIRNVIYRGVLCLLARKHAADFGGKGNLTTQLFYDTRQDHHHIFPTAALQRLGIQDPRSNTIVNKTLISASVNRSIGGRLPSQYVAQWRQELGANTFDSILETHAVNPRFLTGDQWAAFVLDRRERLRAMVEEACGGYVQPFAGTDASEVIVEAADEDELAA